MPNYQDMDWSGLAFSKAEFDAVTSIDAEVWKNELAGVKEWFDKMGGKMPAKLALIRDLLAQSF